MAPPVTLRSRTQTVAMLCAVVGGLLLGIGNGFVTYGELTVPSGIAAVSAMILSSSMRI